ncbi:3-phosphoshikimate 1-carboxyvinyltransferase [Croceitalea sp. MTPC9]|uniref:3-phosphoshikimate 1-carboxyvinyltransferase n=1 Tax=unclassified Croceitalea TaxID=2632280 RepID=UPI002B3EFD06|nr:3-phosphoshikimate 1-carboxyvinyltransferase [Croceitalea sp. MTPC6]GMN17523.1 3-phosphoshikimate 1-carboxyvinyltransferase [Croceitalea sp. MTPC9]
MKLHLSGPSDIVLNTEIKITGSKSETNRLLLLQALFQNITIANLSNSDDAQVMEKGLKISKGEVDIHHAGTAMRFLTSYFAISEGKEVILTGSDRMKERPIKVLVDALISMGADISYAGNEGYPPLKIRGKNLEKSTVSLPANISSQYISSLILVAPSLEKGLEIELVGKITSVPYIKMTLALLKEVGIDSDFVGNSIRVYPMEKVAAKDLVVESDWSAASYFYSIVALSGVGSEIKLSSYKKSSLQGDSILSKIYEAFGVKTTFLENSILLKKEDELKPKTFSLNLRNAPDIAQTIAVTCLGLGMDCHLTGLHTLPIKETDRLAAMKIELEKLGAEVAITSESLTLMTCKVLKKDIAIDTYNDHRMAMAFAPIAFKTDLFINDAGVVSKSYPDFWKDMKTIGITVNKV